MKIICHCCITLKLLFSKTCPMTIGAMNVTILSDVFPIPNKVPAKFGAISMYVHKTHAQIAPLQKDPAHRTTVMYVTLP